MESHVIGNDPFIIRLIDGLKEKEFISQGIMLPLVIGAYKVKENFQGDDYLEFIEHAYNDIIESLYTSGRYLYFRECEASHNFVVEPVKNKPTRCNATICHKGKDVIYCCDDAIPGDGKEMEAKDKDSRTYFLNKLLEQTVRYCNFVSTIADIKDFTPGMHEIEKEDEEKFSELDVIGEILDQ